MRRQARSAVGFGGSPAAPFSRFAQASEDPPHSGPLRGFLNFVTLKSSRGPGGAGSGGGAGRI